jgi:FMN phosphatase YigB (HAD superfamily)
MSPGSPKVRAVLFDVDGTLYHQPPMRALMSAELAALPWWSRRPAEVRALWTALRTFRQVREELRELGRPAAPLASLQYEAAARRCGLAPEFIEAAVDEWMLQRPLRYVARVGRTGLRDVLVGLGALGLRVGAFSDYPVAGKLSALGVADAVPLQLCAVDPEINAFKPHPWGFLHACSVWQLHPSEVVYVGDRPEVDAAGAQAAGLRPVIIGRSPVVGAAVIGSLDALLTLLTESPEPGTHGEAWHRL